MPYKDKIIRNQKSKVYRKKWLSKRENQKKQQLATANWKRAHPDAAYKIQRTAYLKKHYGITYDIYQELLAKGNNACWICKKPQEKFQKNLSVDHDHITGEIRGLTCYTCNRNLLSNHTDPELFLAAYEYLKAPRLGYIVPKEFLKGVHRKRKKK